MSQQFLLEGPAQPLAREPGGGFAGQCQVADDDADAGAVQRFGDAVVVGAFSGIDQQVEERVKSGQAFMG